MRLLFSFAGGAGHFEPLVPVARAAAAAGHEVAVTCAAAMLGVVEGRGFAALRTVDADECAAPERRPLVALDEEREDRVLRQHYAGRLARARAEGLLARCREWAPDVVVRDEADFGAAVAAERLGLPCATVLVIAAGSFVRPEVVAEPLDALRAEHGLPPDPELRALARELVLCPFPPELRDPAFPLPATALALRSTPPAPAPGELPPRWLGGVHGAVYFSLGSIFGLESGDLFPRVLAGLRELGRDVVVTVGRSVDPAELGPQPPHVRVERHVPLAAVLPRCAAVVSHAGSGTVMGALAHGLPSVLLPLGADQGHNARRCAALGVAQVLDAVRATPAEVREAAAAVLADPGYREAAERLRAANDALPGPGRAVAALEALAG
jgi:UDP:flavonoid glycosyltransferase YjiC (YdhE family)